MNYSLDPINCNIFMFGVPCYFSKSRFDQWSNDSDKYKYIFNKGVNSHEKDILCGKAKQEHG